MRTARCHPQSQAQATRLSGIVIATLRTVFLTVYLTMTWSISANADVSLSYLETAGRYADLRNEVEARVAHGNKADSTLLSYLCIAYGRLKQYEKLFDCVNRLEQRIATGEFNFVLDESIMFISNSDARPLPDNLRARAYLELAEYAKAASSSEKVLKMLSQIPETGGTSLYPTVRYRISALEVLALSSVRLGDMEKAEKVARQLDDVSRPFIGGRMWGWIKNNALAQVYMAMGRYGKALEYIPESPAGMGIVVSFVNGLGPYAYRGDSSTTVIEMPRLIMRGKALAETEKTAEAKAAFDEALSSARIKDFGDLFWVALYERGRLAEKEKELNLAAGYYRQAIEIVELQRSSINTEASKIGFVGDKQALYAKLIGILVEQGKLEDAFEYAERSKSRALVDMLSGEKNFSNKAADPETARRLLRDLDAVNLSNPVTDDNRDPNTDGVRRILRARLELQSSAPEFSSLVTVSSVPLEEIRSLLGDDERLVEYYYWDNKVYVFVLARNDLQAIRLDGIGLAEEVARFRSAIESPGSSRWQEPARALYARIWKPLEKILTGTNLVVVGHGVLHYLPFAAMQSDDGTLVIDKYTLRSLPSAAVLKYLRRPLQVRSTLVAFGNPDLGDPKLDLQFAQDEAVAIAGLFPDSLLLVRRDATKRNLTKLGTAFSRLHFATHAKFQPDDPLSSGLYLTRDQGDDGVVTAGELYAMRLDADLVTLSACETGLGKIANGDDVVGLTRGFLYAGARSVVASLWSVEDRATGQLMAAFYANLATSNKGQALRNAQLKIRETFPHPFFWAAFVLTGNRI